MTKLCIVTWVNFTLDENDDSLSIDSVINTLTVYIANCEIDRIAKRFSYYDGLDRYAFQIKSDWKKYACHFVEGYSSNITIIIQNNFGVSAQ